MFDEQDKEWMKATMFEQSTRATKEGIKDHLQLTHGPLDERMTRIDAKAGTSVKIVLLVVVGCVAIGAAAQMIVGK